MANSLTPGETARRGQAIYDETIRPEVEPALNGKYVLVDVETGEYEVGDDYYLLSRQIRARKPGARLFGARIGYPALAKIGGWGRSPMR